MTQKCDQCDRPCKGIRDPPIPASQVLPPDSAELICCECLGIEVADWCSLCKTVLKQVQIANGDRCEKCNLLHYADVCPKCAS